MSDQITFLAERVVTTLRADVEEKVAELTHKVRGVDSRQLRLRLWVVESTIVLLAGESSRAETVRLEQFFDAFWSDIAKELENDFPGEDKREAFDLGMDRLTAEIESDRQQLPHEEAAMALGKRIAAFLEVPESEPLGYGYKLSTASKLLDHLPE
jgi:hypothetical protein